MTFLAPISMLIAGVLAGLTLLAFYLLKLRRRPLRVSSTMLWEQAAADLEVNVPLRWLRRSWLLLLHLLILALFVLAIGRPAFDGGRSTGQRLIILLDRSASMNATDAVAAPSRLDAAKSRVTDLVRAHQRGRSIPQITLVAFAADPVVVAPPTSDPREVDRQLTLIEPTDQPADLRAALRLAETLARPSAADAESDPAPTTVVLISDGGDLPPAADDPLTLAGASFVFLRVGPAQGAPRDNAAVVSIAAARAPDRPRVVRVFVRLTQTRPEPRAISAALLIDGRLEKRFAVRVPGAAADAPGSAVRTIEVDLPDESLVTIILDVPDDLSADNEGSVLVGPARRPGVLLVAPGEGNEPTPDPFLVDVLAAHGVSPLRIVPRGTYERNARALSGFDLVIFDRVEPAALPEIPSLHFGVGFTGFAQREPGRPRPILPTTRVGSWDRDHPALAPITLDSLVVARRIDLPESSAQPGSYRVLATGDTGPLIVELQAAGAGRLVVGFALAQSNWPVQVGFPVFIAAAIDHLAPVGVGAPGRASSTGDPGQIRTVRGSLGATVVVPVNLSDPRESSIATRDEARVAGATVSGAQTGAIGQRELWPWLIGAILVLLLVEWVAFALKMRV